MSHSALTKVSWLEREMKKKKGKYFKVKENFISAYAIKARFIFRVNFEFSRMCAAFSTRDVGDGCWKKIGAFSLSLFLD